MRNPNFKYPDTKAFNFVVNRLEEKGITLNDLAQLVYDMQKDFEKINLKECKTTVEDVLHKRELLNNAMVGLTMDQLTETGQVPEPLKSIITNDAGVFGVDETLALQIANIYGTIGTTNIQKIDTEENHVNTFLDDLIAAIVAAACGKIAHQYA